MDVFDGIFERARAKRARLILPEMDAPEIAAAAKEIETLGIGAPVPLDPVDDTLIETVIANRPKMKPGAAAKLLSRPIFRSGAMVAAGRADAMVAGLTVPTKKVIEAAGLTIGTVTEGVSPASFFLMLLGDAPPLIFADCAVTVAPDAEALAMIGQAASEAATGLWGTGRVAALSYATGTSGAGPSVDRVAAACEIMAGKGVDCVGPVQADAALNVAIGAKKGIEGARPDVLLFPDINAGNIGYKLVQELAGAQAVGPVLTGLRRPVSDLSRGATTDDIVKTAALTLALT